MDHATNPTHAALVACQGAALTLRGNVSFVPLLHPGFYPNCVIGRGMLLHYPDSVLLIRLIIDGTSYKCRPTMDPLLKAYFFFGGALTTS